MITRLSLALLIVSLAPPVGAHFTMLLPAQPAADKEQAVEFVYQWGKPFEHELFEAPAPESLGVLLPDGKTQDLLRSLEKIKKPGADGKDVTAFRFRFTPKQ